MASRPAGPHPPKHTSKYSKPDLIVRDPVCKTIEHLLKELGSTNGVKLLKVDGDHTVALRFGNVKAEGISYDIALVRLATALVDDEKYSRPLAEALRAPLLASVA